MIPHLAFVASLSALIGLAFFGTARADSSNHNEMKSMKLELQIEQLSGLGITLNDGVSVDDFLISFDRKEYEDDPFGLILFVYGSEIEEEPWGRYFSDRAWNFDTECIEDTGDYVSIVENFHRITGRARKLEGLSDFVDIDEGKARLEYTVDGIKRSFEIKVDNDWADPDTVSTVMEDLMMPGFNFYAKDNGQASIWFYLNQEEAKKLNDLAGNAFGLDSKPWWKFW